MFQHDQWGAAVHGQFLGHAAVEEAFQEPRVPVQYRHRIGVLPLGDDAPGQRHIVACSIDVPVLHADHGRTVIPWWPTAVGPRSDQSPSQNSLWKRE